MCVNESVSFLLKLMLIFCSYFCTLKCEIFYKILLKDRSVFFRIIKEDVKYVLVHLGIKQLTALKMGNIPSELLFKNLD